MKKLLFPLLFLCLCLTSQAQNHIVEKNSDGIIFAVRFSPSSDRQDIPDSEVAFFKEYLNTTSDDHFVKVPHTSKRKEFVHDHFDQYYKGIKVEGGGL